MAGCEEEPAKKQRNIYLRHWPGPPTSGDHTHVQRRNKRSMNRQICLGKPPCCDAGDITEYNRTRRRKYHYRRVIET